MNLQNITLSACEICKRAGKFIAGEAQGFDAKKIEVKSFNQLVSYVDKTAEEMLVKELSMLIPDAGFITEEATIKTQKKEWTWIIDPLDGTTNFMHGIPVYSVSVGLLHNEELVAGIVYEINRDEMFYAWQGSKAFMNGKEIRVAQNNSLSESLLATGFPYYDFEIMQQYLQALQVFMKDTRGMRRMGSAAVDLAYVACGRFDGFFEYGLNAWDVAGGALIVKQAGGIISDFNGKENFLFGKEIIAASPNVYAEFAGVIKEKFNR